MKSIALFGLGLALVSAPLLAQQPSAGDQQSMSAAFMQHMDTNKDGKVTYEEFEAPAKAQAKAQFDHMDKNKDGIVDSAEVDAFAQEMQQQMQRMQQQQGSGQMQR